jgi:hypothetical protein
MNYVLQSVRKMFITLNSYFAYHQLTNTEEIHGFCDRLLFGMFKTTLLQKLIYCKNKIPLCQRMDLYR